jgi:hypothetical protein
MGVGAASRGMHVAVRGRLGISVSQFRNKRRRAAYFDPGGVPFQDIKADASAIASGP